MPRLPSSIFIDTGAFLAWELRRDQHHEHARDGWETLANSTVRLFTSEHVIDETLTLLARRAGYAHAARRGKDYLQGHTLRILQSTPDDLERAIGIMEKYADQQVSYTDCISFSLMKREKLRSVFGFGRHFTTAGFRLWNQPAA